MFLLEGRDGATIVEQAVNMAPCHLPDIDGTVDASLLRSAWQCQGCGGTQERSKMLVCDGCGRAWHMWCTVPAVKVVPVGTWVCQECTRQGYSADGGGMEGEYRPPPTVTAKLRDERGRQLHGRRVAKEFDVGPGVRELHEGTVAFEATAHPPGRVPHVVRILLLLRLIRVSCVPKSVPVASEVVACFSERSLQANDKGFPPLSQFGFWNEEFGFGFISRVAFSVLFIVEKGKPSEPVLEVGSTTSY